MNEMISRLAELVEQYYLLPEEGRAMAERLSARAGDLAQAEAGKPLADALTTVMREVNPDKHLRVFHPGVQVLQPGAAMTREELARSSALANGYVRKVERLAGNVGYLELLQLDNPAFSGEVLAAAMTLVADSSALLVDLTRCRGGAPEMVQFLCTYLLDRPTHLNSLYWRERDQTTEYWTLPYVPGKRFGGTKPLFLLTSRRTASAGEEFTYNLTNLKRAIQVGETTAGAANPGRVHPLPDGYAVFIPNGRPINPITGTNWEGAGIEPEIAVPADGALTAAYREALRQVVAGLKGAEALPEKALRQEAEEALAGLKG